MNMKTIEKIKEYLEKELKEADEQYKQAGDESQIEYYWAGYIDAIDAILHNLFGKESR